MAAALSTHSGPTAPSPNGSGAFAQTCAGVMPHHDDGMPLNRQSIGWSAKAAMLGRSSSGCMAFI